VNVLTPVQGGHERHAKLPVGVDEDAKWCAEHGEFDTRWTPPAAVPCPKDVVSAWLTNLNLTTTPWPSSG